MVFRVPHNSADDSPQTASTLVLLRDAAVLGLAYFVLGKISLLLAAKPFTIAPAWLPIGAALAGLVFRGWAVLPGIAVGALALALTFYRSPVILLGVTLGAAISTGLGLWLLRRWIQGRLEFRRARNAATFMLVVVIIATINATFGMTSLLLGTRLEFADSVDPFVTWWLGDIAGMLALTPVVLLALRGSWRKSLSAFQADAETNNEASAEKDNETDNETAAAHGATQTSHGTRLKERLLIYALLGLMSIAIFGGILPTTMVRPLPYLLLVFLIWSAFRFDQWETSLVSLCTALIAIVCAMLQLPSPFAGETIAQTFVAMQVFIGVMCATGLMLAAIVQQQRMTERDLRSVRDELEQRVSERTSALQSINTTLEQDIAKRRAIEIALQKSEERYRALTDLSPTGIMIHVGGVVQLANAAGLKIMGMDSIDQALGRSVLDFVPIEDRPVVIERMKKIFTGEEAPKLEERFVRLDGSLVDVEVVGIPFVYDDQPAAQLVFTDISERRRAEQKLRENEAKYRALIANSPDIIMQVGRNFAIDFLHLPGAPQATNALGAGMLNVSPEVLHTGLQKAVEEVFRDGNSLRYESSERTIGDELRYYTTYVSPIVNARGGDIAAAYVVSRDITERKRAENSLQHERDLYEALVNSLPGCSIFSISRDVSCVGTAIWRSSRAIPLRKLRR
jgi:PAS domain S-box-containing protein